MIINPIRKRWLLMKFLFCKYFSPASRLIKQTAFGKIIVPYDWIGQNIYLGNYDNEEVDLYQHLLERDHVVIDVGANIGFYTLLFSNLVTGGHVFSFEPSTRERSLLKKNVDLNERANVTVVDRGLGSETTTENLYINNRNFGNNVINDVLSGLPFETIQVDRLDNFISENRLTRVDLIKMDVEGYEIEVLKGSQRSIRQFMPLISFESWSTHNKQFTKNLSKEMDFLSDLGYEFFQFREHSLFKVGEGDLISSVNLIASAKDRSAWLETKMS